MIAYGNFPGSEGDHPTSGDIDCILRCCPHLYIYICLWIYLLLFGFIYIYICIYIHISLYIYTYHYYHYIFRFCWECICLGGSNWLIYLQVDYWESLSIFPFSANWSYQFYSPMKTFIEDFSHIWISGGYTLIITPITIDKSSLWYQTPQPQVEYTFNFLFVALCNPLAFSVWWLSWAAAGGKAGRKELYPVFIILFYPPVVKYSKWKSP